MRKSNKTNNRVNNAAKSSKSINLLDAYKNFVKAENDGIIDIQRLPQATYIKVVEGQSAMFLRPSAIKIAGTNEGIWDSAKSRYVIAKGAWDHAMKVAADGKELAKTLIDIKKKVDVEGATVEELKAYNAIQKSELYPIHEDESFIYIVVDAAAADKPFKTLGFKKVGESNEDKTWVSTAVAKWNRIKAAVTVPEPVKPTASDGKYATKSEFNALSKKVDTLCDSMTEQTALLKQLLGKTEVKGSRKAQSRNSGKSTLRRVSK